VLLKVSALFTLLVTTTGLARAQTVPPTPAPTPEHVAPEQQSIRVGDVILAPAIEAPADEPPRRQAREVEPRRRWYGAPILIADGVAYGSLALAMNVDRAQKVALPLAISTFLLAAPITHVAHGRWGRMGLSVAARAAFPLGGVLLGTTGCTADSDCSGSLATGAIVGMLAATVFDAAVLAYEPAPPEPTVQPVVGLSRDRLWLGAGGTF
jgi:hypothetical protein